MNKFWRRISVLVTLSAIANLSEAEQFQSFGEDQVHYVIVPSEFIESSIAAKHGIVRGANRSFVNVSVLRHGIEPVASQVAGTATNLLGQSMQLIFREVSEGMAIYYIAEFKHTDEDQLIFDITLNVADQSPYQLRFRHKVYLER